MVLEGGLSGAGRERASGDKILDELVVGRERRGNVEWDGVFSDKGDVGDFDIGGGHWSEERMVIWRRLRVLLSVSNGRLR